MEAYRIMTFFGFLHADTMAKKLGLDKVPYLDNTSKAVDYMDQGHAYCAESFR